MSGHGTKDDAPSPRGGARARPNPRQALGRAGETQAARYLEARGYRIVARNVRADRVEIDLIVRRGPLIVFVEVKTRRGRAHGEAAEAVDGRKQRRLRHGASAWLAASPPEARGSRQRRFDVVTCLWDGQGARPEPQKETTAPHIGTRWSIEHWEAAF